MIDLHLHSTFSDGSFTPEELVQRADELGLSAIALTDHDTTKGFGRFEAAGRATQVQTIPGVEISADYKYGTMHILGYYLDVKNSELCTHLDWIRDGRDARNKEILFKLVELGMHITWKQVLQYAGDDVVGRPHFAKLMVDQGYVADASEAFSKYLAKGKAAYANRRRLSPEACIQLIRHAGGIPILAHPITLHLKPPGLRRMVRQLTDFGLQGMEIMYSAHSIDLQRTYMKIAEKFDLIVTGGTDFHGKMSPGISMGTGRGDLKVPDSVLEVLQHRRDRQRPVLVDLGV